MLYAIWYHLYNFKNVKSIDGGLLLLVKLKDLTKSDTRPWVFLTFLNCTNGTKYRKASHFCDNSFVISDKAMSKGNLVSQPCMLKIFFTSILTYFWYSLINWPSYNNLLLIMQLDNIRNLNRLVFTQWKHLEPRLNAFWFCFYSN